MANIVAKRSVSFAGSLNNNNSIKTNVASSASPASYSGAGLDGSYGNGSLVLPRQISVTLTSHTGSYTLNSKVTLTGTDYSGAVQTEQLTITNANGGITLLSTKYFLTVTQVDIEAQVDTLGQFKVGTRDVLATSAKAMRCGTAGDIKIEFEDGTTDTIPKVQAGEQIPCMFKILHGDTTTTAQDITIYI